MEKINFNDFDTLYMNPKEKWDFDLFKIQCVKCGSFKVEHAVEIEFDRGYYGDCDAEGKTIIKCHDCGNALALKINTY